MRATRPNEDRMTPGQWERVRVLFHAALEHPVAQRMEFLGQQSGDDPLVIHEVDSLLRAHDDADEFLDGAALAAVGLRNAISAPRLPPGSRLGAFEIGELLGAGGMGEVYRARDTRLDRAVAIKVLSTELAGHSDAQARFECEARSISRLNHPHICTLYDVGSASVGGEDLQFLVMELLEGQTLAARLSQGPLQVEQAVNLAIDIGDALAAADAHGVVHRDLKPANIMLTKSGVKLLDFGVAQLRPVGSSGRQGAVSRETAPGSDSNFGTLPYMAPEQLKGADADARTDLFAFGAVLYEMIAGMRAFAGESPAALRTAILEHDPVPLAVRQPRTPPSLGRLVATCLAKDPSERWQHARDVTLALKEIEEGIATGRSEQPSFVRAVPNPAASWRVHLAWAVFAAVLAGGLWLRQPAADSTPPPNPRPVIVLMDSPGRVYDTRTLEAGGTNADDISDALRDLPVVTFKENTSSMWHREDEVRRQNPDLIISHLSSLLETRAADAAIEERLFDVAERRLTLFLGYIATDNPRTRFLVYSRSHFATADMEASWVANVVARFPQLKGQLFTLPVPGGRARATFRDPLTVQLVRNRVKDILLLH